MHVQIKMVDPTAAADVATGACPIIKVMAEKTHVFDANMQKWLLLQYNLDSKIESQEWTKHITNKKVVMTIICGQCNDITLTKLALGFSYAIDCDDGNIIK